LTFLLFRLSLTLVRINVQTKDTAAKLRERGIQPSAHRIAVGDYVLYTNEHPSADLVWKRVRERFPWISRATIYNTLNLFADEGLLLRLNLSEDSVVFDPITETHHHFIDENSGAIYDVPWDHLQVCNIESLREFDVHDYQVVMRGSVKGPSRKT
jgi:Fe2+ or Zn2+ uptake regulation protein